MNKDQIKGKTKEITGEVKQQVGRAMGDKSTELRGHAKEMEGKAQKKVGNVKEDLRDSNTQLDAERDARMRREGKL